jgi:hypothetical protein
VEDDALGQVGFGGVAGVEALELGGAKAVETDLLGTGEGGVGGGQAVSGASGG